MTGDAGGVATTARRGLGARCYREAVSGVLGPSLGAAGAYTLSFQDMANVPSVAASRPVAGMQRITLHGLQQGLVARARGSGHMGRATGGCRWARRGAVNAQCTQVVPTCETVSPSSRFGLVNPWRHAPSGVALGTPWKGIGEVRPHASQCMMCVHHHQRHRPGGVYAWGVLVCLGCGGCADCGRVAPQGVF